MLEEGADGAGVARDVPVEENQDANPVVLVNVRVDVLREESQGANPVVLVNVLADAPSVQGVAPVDAPSVPDVPDVPDVQSAGKYTQKKNEVLSGKKASKQQNSRK